MLVQHMIFERSMVLRVGVRIGFKEHYWYQFLKFPLLRGASDERQENWVVRHKALQGDVGLLMVSDKSPSSLCVTNFKSAQEAGMFSARHKALSSSPLSLNFLQLR